MIKYHTNKQTTQYHTGIGDKLASKLNNPWSYRGVVSDVIY